MNKLNIVCIAIVTLIVAGCSVFPIPASIKDNHFRFENFVNDKGADKEYVHLMCFRKRPVGWDTPKQYVAGEHNLWVKAQISKRDIQNSKREAFVNFELALAAGESYQLNHKVEGDLISIWIQNSESKKVVSEIKEAKLALPKLVENRLRREQCESGTI